MQSLAHLWIKRIWQERDIGALDDLHSPGFMDRSPSGRGSDLASYREGLIELFEAFPDFFTTCEDIVEDRENSRVAIRWSATGTHRGTFLGAEATGKTIQFRGIEILSVDSEHRINERWGEWDGIDLLMQLGVIRSEIGGNPGGLW